VTAFIFSLPYTWIYILNFFSIFNPNNSNLNFDSWNLIIALFVGIASVVFLRQQNKIAQIALEQNRPILSFQINESQESKPYFYIENQGSVEATDIAIFYKTNNTGIQKHSIPNEIVLSPNSKYKITLDTANEGYYSILIIFKNPLSNRYYLFGTNANFENDVSPIGSWNDKVPSPVSVVLYSKISEFVNNHQYKEQLSGKLQKYLEEQNL
jgi:hypothetical protein